MHRSNYAWESIKYGTLKILQCYCPSLSETRRLYQKNAFPMSWVQCQYKNRYMDKYRTIWGIVEIKKTLVVIKNSNRKRR